VVSSDARSNPSSTTAARLLLLPRLRLPASSTSSTLLLHELQQLLG
jgi:hypothetical protein